MSKIPYNHKAIEKKWREKWEENPVNVQYDENGNKKEKYYWIPPTVTVLPHSPSPATALSSVPQVRPPTVPPP